MILKRNSKVVRWAYLLKADMPYYTSICPLFWRVVLLTPMKIAFILGVISLFVSAICFLAYGALVKHWQWGWSIVCLLTLMFSAIHWYQSCGKTSRKQPSVIAEYFKAAKTKVCPTVTLE